MLRKNMFLLCDKGHKLHEISEKFYNLLLYKAVFLSQNEFYCDGARNWSAWSPSTHGEHQ
jgi:hypothetical protein